MERNSGILVQLLLLPEGGPRLSTASLDFREHLLSDVDPRPQVPVGVHQCDKVEIRWDIADPKLGVVCVEELSFCRFAAFSSQEKQQRRLPFLQIGRRPKPPVEFLVDDIQGDPPCNQRAPPCPSLVC